MDEAAEYVPATNIARTDPVGYKNSIRQPAEVVAGRASPA